MLQHSAGPDVLAHIAQLTNSNEARLLALERRMTGDGALPAVELQMPIGLDPAHKAISPASPDASDQNDNSKIQGSRKRKLAQPMHRAPLQSTTKRQSLDSTARPHAHPGEVPEPQQSPQQTPGTNRVYSRTISSYFAANGDAGAAQGTGGKLSSSRLTAPGNPAVVTPLGSALHRQPSAPGTAMPSISTNSALHVDAAKVHVTAATGEAEEGRIEGVGRVSTERPGLDASAGAAGGALQGPASSPCARCLSLEQQGRHAKAALEDQLQQVSERHKETQGRLTAVQDEIATLSERTAKREAGLREALRHSITQQAQLERVVAACKARDLSVRLGRLTVMRTGAYAITEVWEDGTAFRELAERVNSIAKQREAIEQARKAARRRLPPPGQFVPENRTPTSEFCGVFSASSQAAQAQYLHPDDYVVKEEIFKVRLAALKREEDSCKHQRDQLELEKLHFARELKRLQDAEGSRWNNMPLLHSRYQLGNLLGKGGFSEVYKAFDLQNLEYVAVKIHQLNPQWSESMKQAYVKHAIRECSIHKDLHHPRIVALHDIFEINQDTFATVLELCDGGDLDTYIKEKGTLPEKEARVIMSQVLSGLEYLNHPGRRVIHYDLKPANILFDDVGECKITDFGLSKIVEEGQTMGMELTSQGAGTYWYLPPECFQMNGPHPPRISNKVDVWSCGVILYQLLYGKRPFGEGCSQEHILRNGIMLNARQVDFPPKPAVSQDAKEFITKCLMYRPEDRLDIHEAAAHPYMALTKRARAITPAAKENIQKPLLI